MKIMDNIQEAAIAFCRRTGHRPTSAYLGRNEADQLLHWARVNGYYQKTPDLHDIERQKRPEVHGLKVYVVNAESHLACA